LDGEHVVTFSLVSIASKVFSIIWIFKQMINPWIYQKTQPS